jgi:hypothetical protein
VVIDESDRTHRRAIVNAGAPWSAGVAVLIVGAGLTAPPALAKCGSNCKKVIASEFKACKTACSKDKVCKKACTDEKKADAVACKAATNPAPPDCGEATTTTTSTTRPLSLCTTTTIPLCGPGPSPPYTCSVFGACPGGQTCQSDGTGGCGCVGPPPACGNAGVFFCRTGTCPAGQTCQTVCGGDGNLSCQCH